jgi:hypothetical protein
MGMTAEQFPDPENSAVLAIHYMLDFMCRKDPKFRSRVMAKLALIHLSNLGAPEPGPVQ